MPIIPTPLYLHLYKCQKKRRGKKKHHNITSHRCSTGEGKSLLAGTGGNKNKNKERERERERGYTIIDTARIPPKTKKKKRIYL